MPSPSVALGSPEKFETLYHDYVDKIYAFLFHKTLHRETAEDLTSETFLKALQHADSYNPQKAKISTWLYSIARNAVIDFYRTRKSHADIDDIWDIDGGEDATEEADRGKNFEALQRSMQKLKPEQREILTMRFWQDLSYAEIAEATGKSEANVRMIISRAVKKMKPDFCLFLLFPFLFLS